jgi:glycosyltransferase 2 family protein
MLSRTLCIAQRVFPWVALIGATAGLFAIWRSQHQAIVRFEWDMSWPSLACAAVAYAVAPLAQAVSFWLALRLLTGKSPLLETLVVWSRSYVLRYAPTGALAIAYRLHSRERMRASTEQVLAAYAYEHVGSLTAGSAACIGIFALAGGVPPPLPFAIATGALGLAVVARPGIAGRAAQAAARRLGLHVHIVLSGRAVAAVVGVNLVGWLGTGTAVYVLVSGLVEDSPSFTWLVGAYTAGYLVGFVMPLAPGGIGAREGALVTLFAARWGIGASTALSLAIRLANVTGELLAVAIVHAVYGVSLAGRILTRGFGAPQPV